MNRPLNFLSSTKTQSWWIASAVFSTYFCMYMYRKPYTAATFEGQLWYGIDYKTALIVSQVMGYALSKVIGIKLISQLQKSKRIIFLVSLISTAYFSLVAFYFSPMDWGPMLLFINGLPLGLVWGVVFSYCEGRRITEILTVVLSLNFILTSGFAKSLGRYAIELGVSEALMPAVIGGVTMPFFILSIWMLGRIGDPDYRDVEERSLRPSMSMADMRGMLSRHGWTIGGFTIIYLVLTVIRDIRDNFAVELWHELGSHSSPSVYSASELVVTIVILPVLGKLYKIKNNQSALQIQFLICSFAIIVLILSSILIQLELIPAFMWMTLIGLGLFVPYILLNGIIFDRYIASFRIVANVGFVMYLVDSAGYLSSITVMMFKNFSSQQGSWLELLQYLCIVGGSLALGVLLTLGWYLHKKVLIQEPRPTTS